MRPLRNAWALVLAFAVPVVITGLIEFLPPQDEPLDWLIRAFALLGYQLIFLAILSSALLRELVRFFGRPFIHIHHALSIAGLVLITLHPLGVALRQESLRVFIPSVESVYSFLLLGGRPAWILLLIALLAVLLRKFLGGTWRWVHMLNYIAFALGTAHAILIGSNLQHPIPRVVAVALALVALLVFVRKRLPQRRSIANRKS